MAEGKERVPARYLAARGLRWLRFIPRYILSRQYFWLTLSWCTHAAQRLILVWRSRSSSQRSLL